MFGIGVFRFARAHVFYTKGLDDFAMLHYCDMVADVTDDSQIMADHKIGQITPGAKICQQIKDLGLH